jgi:hypothetical protein
MGKKVQQIKSVLTLTELYLACGNRVVLRCRLQVLPRHKYSRTPLIRFNWDEESFGYAENPDNWIFIRKQATLAVGSGKKILQTAV